MITTTYYIESTVFAWLPIRTQKGNLRWLRKVKKVIRQDEEGISTYYKDIVKVKPSEFTRELRQLREAK